MDRLNVDDYFVIMARLVSLRGTCLRRKVGCVLVDAKNRVLATGYNGTASKQPHCGDPGCLCNGYAHASGEGLDACHAIHAEQNALLQCTRPDDVWAAYVTVTPCVTCAKLLLNTGVQRVVAWEPYAHDEETLKIFKAASVEVKIYNLRARNDALCSTSSIL